MAVMGTGLAPGAFVRGRTAMPFSSARVGKGSDRMAASTAPDSSAGTMSGKGMSFTAVSSICQERNTR